MPPKVSRICFSPGLIITVGSRLSRVGPLQFFFPQMKISEQISTGIDTYKGLDTEPEALKLEIQ